MNDDLTSLFDSFYEDEPKEDDLTSLFDSFYDEEPQEQGNPYALQGEPAPTLEPSDVVESAEPKEPETEYHPWGALKHSAWQGVKAIGGGLPGAIGRVIPGEDWFEKVSKENKAFYDDIMGDDEDIKEYVKSIQNESEGFATEVLGNIGPTAAGLGTALIPFAGPVLATGMFYDLNTSEIEDMAIQKGADKATAERVGVAGGLINTALDMTGIGRMAKAFKPAKNAAVNRLANLLIGMGITAGVEGGTEGVQGVVGEITSDWAVKPKEETTEQFAERMWGKKDQLIETFKHDASIGAVTGGGIHAVGATVSPLIRKKEENQDDIDKVLLPAYGTKKDALKALKNPDVQRDLRTGYGFTQEDIEKKIFDYTPIRKEHKKIEEKLTALTKKINTTTPPDPVKETSEKIERELTEAPLSLEMEQTANTLIAEGDKVAESDIPAQDAGSEVTETPFDKLKKEIEGKPIRYKQDRGGLIEEQGPTSEPGKVKPSIEKDLPTPENKAPEPPTKPVIEPSVDEKGKEVPEVAPGEDVDSEGVGATKEPTQEDEKYSSKLPSDKYGIYKTNINGNVKYAVRENMDNDRGFGDSIYNSEKDAEEYVAMSKKRDAANAKFREKQNIEQAKIDKAEKEQALKREDIDGFGDDLKPLQKGKALFTLNKTKRFNGKPMTVKDKIREMVANGEAETTSYETNKIKPMSRRAYNRASNEEQEAHERKIKKGGKKTIYTVGGYELGKTAYDYANFLNAKSSNSRFDTPTPKKVKELDLQPSPGVGKRGEDNLRRQIAEASRKPLPKIVPVYKLKGSDEKWYRAGGFPHGVTSTGEKRLEGYAYQDKNGQKYGTHGKTEQELIDRHTEGQNKTVENFYNELEGMSENDIQSQADFWLKQKGKSQIPEPSKLKNRKIKPLGTGDERSDEFLRKYRKLKKAGRGMTAAQEKALKTYEKQVKANPNKWKKGDGVGWRVDKQINRGYQVAEINKEKKLALVKPVADTGLTVTGGGMEGVGNNWVHIADLVRDKKYNKTPTQQSKSTLPKEDPQARKDISQRHNVPPESLEYHAPWKINGKTQPLQADPERLEQLRKDVYGWLKEVLPRSILKNRIAVELSPNISKEGKDVSESDRQWSEIKDPGAIMGAATVDKLNALIELSYNYDNDTIQKNAYHESFHVAARWLLPDADYKTVMDHFSGNEEKAAEAFADFAMKVKGRKAQPSFIYKVFRNLRMIFKRVRNGLKGQGYKTSEDVFGKLWKKQYDLLPQETINERVDAGKTVNEFAQPAKLSLANAVKSILDNPKFRKWFGGSKVVGEDGEPLVVYHGHYGPEFFKFRTRRATQYPGGERSLGAYFTGSKKESKKYGDTTRPVYLDMKNPLDLSDILEDSQRTEEFLKRFGASEDFISDYMRQTEAHKYTVPYLLAERADLAENIVPKLKKKGHDGIMFNENGTVTYVAFHPTQIKSIFNTEFDGDNPDIRFTRADKSAKPKPMTLKKGPGKTVEITPPTPEDGKLFNERNRLTNIDRNGSMWSAIERENPGVDFDQPVKVYRATVGNEINPNDFVAANKDVATAHLENLKDRGEKGTVISKTVNTSDLLMGNDATEFQYSPGKPTTETSVNPEGGRKLNTSEKQTYIESSPLKNAALKYLEKKKKPKDTESLYAAVKMKESAQTRYDNRPERVPIWSPFTGAIRKAIKDAGFIFKDSSQSEGMMGEIGESSYYEHPETKKRLRLSNHEIIHERSLSEVTLHPGSFSNDAEAIQAIKKASNPNQSRPSVKEGQPSTQLSVVGDPHNPIQSTKIDNARSVLGRFFNDAMYWIVDKNRPITTVQKHMNRVDDKIDVFLKETQRPKITAAKVRFAWDDHVRPLIERMAEYKVNVQDLELYKHALHAPEANDALRKANSKSEVEKIKEVFVDKKRKLRETIQDLKGEGKGYKKEAEKLKAASKAVRDINKRIDGLEKPEEWYNALNGIINTYESTPGLKRVIKKWNTFSEKPSGMTDEESAEILNRYKGDKKIEELGRMLDVINDNKLQLLYDSGLLEKSEYKAIRDKYKHYVPLYREGFDDSLFGVSRGLKPSGRQVKVRGGSTREVVDILAHSVANYEKAINASEKAVSQKALLGLVRANRDSGIIKVSPVKKTPRHDSNGNLRMYPDLFNVADNEMRLMVSGKQYLVSVNRDNKDAMLMMRTLKAEDNMGGPLVNFLSKINRFLAKVNTTWSPEFIISNFVRDIQTAGINIQDTGVKGKGLLKGAKAAWGAIYATERGKPRGTALEGYYGRFKTAGGKIGWSDVHGSVENLTKKITSEIEMKSGKRPVRKRVNDWLRFIEDVNTSIENGVRLHVFKLAVDQGKTDEQAARIASDLTVDFTKKGAAGPVINSLYLFANAGIQGTYRIMRASAKSKGVQKTLAGIIGAGFAVGMLNALAGGEDEDGEDHFNKIDEFVRERNMIIMIPGTDGKYAKIPLPWGYNLFWNIGSEISRAFTKEDFNPLASTGRLLSVFANAFNPVASGTLLQTLSPTIGDPIAQIAENKNWFGGPLMPEQNKFAKVPTPDSQRYWKTAGTVSKWVSAQLNELTGGDKVKSGVIDVSPETLDLMVDTAGGSAFRFVKDVFGVPLKAIQEEKIEMSKIPFVRRVAGEKSEWADSKTYFKNSEDVFIAEAQFKAYRGTPEYKNIIAATRFERAIMSFTKETENRLRRLRKRLNRAKVVNNKEVIEKINQLIKDTYVRYNKRYALMRKRYKA